MSLPRFRSRKACVYCFIFAILVAMSVFLIPAQTAQATFYGDPKVGLQPISSDRYGASYYAPADFSPEKDWPLVIVLYSDETYKGADFMERWLSEIKKREVIALFVSYLDPRETPFSSDKRFFALIEEVKKLFPIDEKRILLTAFGEAAHYAFYLGCRYPQQFSSVALVAGGAQGRFEPLVSYSHVGAKKIPFVVLYGSQDKNIQKEQFIESHKRFTRRGYQIELEEFEGLGHELYPEWTIKIMDWFSALPIAEEMIKEKSGEAEEEVSSIPFGIPRFVVAVVRGIVKG